MEKGFVAEAQTIASLQLEADASQNGSVQFSLELDDENLLAVSVDYSGKNLSPLVSKINQYFIVIISIFFSRSNCNLLLY